MRDDVPHPEMCKSPIAVKHSRQKRLAHSFCDFFLPARSRLTHSLNSLTAPEWSRWRFPKVTLYPPDKMMSGPGSGRITNVVPVLWICRLRLVEVLLGSHKSLLLSWMGSRSNSLSARPSDSPGFCKCSANAIFGSALSRKLEIILSG